MGQKKFDEEKRHHFGAWLMYLRKDRKLSLAEVEGLTGIPLATLSKWERTGKMGNVGRIIALAKVYGVNLNTLLRIDNIAKLNVSDAYLHKFFPSDRKKRAGFCDPGLKPPPMPEIDKA